MLASSRALIFQRDDYMALWNVEMVYLQSAHASKLFQYLLFHVEKKLSLQSEIRKPGAYGLGRCLYVSFL